MNETRQYVFWVVRAQQGDVEALGELLDSFQPLMRKEAYRLGLRESDADDLCQEVSLLVMRYLDDLREPGAFPSWVVRILRNQAQKGGRNRLVPFSVLAGEDGQTDVDGGVADVDAGVLLDEQAVGVRDAVQTLSPILRETVRLHYFQGESVQTISELMNVPVGTVKRRLFDARKHLEQRLTELAA